MSGKSVGIYLGEKYSVVAFKDATVRVIATGPNNEDLCRSCVAIDRSGSFIVGNAPYNNWRRYGVSCISPWMPTTCLTKNPAQAEHEEGYVCNAPQLRPESFHLRIDGFC